MATITVKKVQNRRSFTAGYRPPTTGGTALAEGEQFFNLTDGVLAIGTGAGAFATSPFGARVVTRDAVNTFSADQTFGAAASVNGLFTTLADAWIRDGCISIFKNPYGHTFNATVLSVTANYGTKYGPTWGNTKEAPPKPAINAQDTPSIAVYGGSENVAHYTGAFVPPPVASGPANFTATTATFTGGNIPADRFADIKVGMIVKTGVAGTAGIWTGRIVAPLPTSGATFNVDGWYNTSGTAGTPTNGTTVAINAITAAFVRNTVGCLESNSWGKTVIIDEIDCWNLKGDFDLSNGGPSVNGIDVVAVGTNHNNFAYNAGSQGGARARFQRGYTTSSTLFAGFEQAVADNTKVPKYGFLYNVGAANDVDGNPAIAYSVGNGLGDVRFQVLGGTGNMSVGAGILPNNLTRILIRASASDGSSNFLEGSNAATATTFQVKDTGKAFFNGGIQTGTGSAGNVGLGRDSAAANRLAIQTEASNGSTNAIFVNNSGGANIATLSDQGILNTLGQITTQSSKIRIANGLTIPSSGTSGNQGDICWDTTYLYVCTGTNTWRRISLGAAF